MIDDRVFSVMPGLVPGIHVLTPGTAAKDVDGRDKPGHDGVGQVNVIGKCSSSTFAECALCAFRAAERYPRQLLVRAHSDPNRDPLLLNAPSGALSTETFSKESLCTSKGECECGNPAIF